MKRGESLKGALGKREVKEEEEQEDKQYKQEEQEQEQEQEQVSRGIGLGVRCWVLGARCSVLSAECCIGNFAGNDEMTKTHDIAKLLNLSAKRKEDQSRWNRRRERIASLCVTCMLTLVVSVYFISSEGLWSTVLLICNTVIYLQCTPCSALFCLCSVPFPLLCSLLLCSALFGLSLYNPTDPSSYVTFLTGGMLYPPTHLFYQVHYVLIRLWVDQTVVWVFSVRSEARVCAFIFFSSCRGRGKEHSTIKGQPASQPAS